MCTQRAQPATRFVCAPRDENGDCAQSGGRSRASPASLDAAVAARARVDSPGAAAAAVACAPLAGRAALDEHAAAGHPRRLRRAGCAEERERRRPDRDLQDARPRAPPGSAPGRRARGRRSTLPGVRPTPARTQAVIAALLPLPSPSRLGCRHPLPTLCRGRKSPRPISCSRTRWRARGTTRR